MGIPEHVNTTVPPRKVGDYLLSSDHPVGRAKAVFFLSIGFDRGKPQGLESALLQHARSGDLVSTERTAFGDRFVVEGPLRSPQGKDALVRTVWFAEAEHEAVLVTAYPIRGLRAPRVPPP